MKYAFPLLLSLFFIGRAQAQAKTASAREETRLKVLFSKSGMTVTYLDKLIPIGNIQSLDSLVKKISDPQHLRMEYENNNGDPEQSLAIIRTLEKCSCHLVTKSTKIQD